MKVMCDSNENGGNPAVPVFSEAVAASTSDSFPRATPWSSHSRRRHLPLRISSACRHSHCGSSRESFRTSRRSCLLIFSAFSPGAEEASFLVHRLLRPTRSDSWRPPAWPSRPPPPSFFGYRSSDRAPETLPSVAGSLEADAESSSPPSAKGTSRA